MRTGIRWLIVGSFLLGLVPGALAEGFAPFLLHREFGPRAEIAYRYQHPHLVGNDLDVGILMGMHEFSFAVPVGDGTALWAALPLAKWSLGDYELSDETAWGNLTVGVQSGGGGQVMGGCDISLPTAQSAGYTLLLTGVVSHPSRPATFVADVLTVRPYLQVKAPLSPESALRFHLGPELLLPTGDNGGDADVLVDYGIGLGLDNGMFALSAEFLGYWLATGDSGSFSDRSEHFLAAGVEYLGTRFRPSLYYEIPTDEDFDNLVDGILGVRLRYLP